MAEHHPTVEPENPTSQILLDFAAYVSRLQHTQRDHMIGDVPDYSFALDGELRQKIASMGPVRSMAQIMVGAGAMLQNQSRQLYNLMVGPRQYPEIYALGEECARRLGVGIPQIYISPIDDCNAFTFATNDITPAVILTRGLVELLDPSELLFIIGHECGHNHNLHGVYNTAAEMLVNPTARMALQKLLAAGAPLHIVRLLASAIQSSMKLFLLNWSRCAEVTADRAGLICCNNLATAERTLLKLVVGKGKLLEQLNVEAFLAQSRQSNTLASIWFDLQQTHPLIARRIEALRVFAESDVYLKWRPDQAVNNPPNYSKVQADRRCEHIVGAV